MINNETIIMTSIYKININM